MPPNRWSDMKAPARVCATSDGPHVFHTPTASEDAVSDSGDSIDEMDVSGLEMGMVVLARGWAPSGVRTWFVARITKFRERFPPVVVTFIATHPTGQTHSLLLPQPKVAHVSSVDIKQLADGSTDDANTDAARSKAPPLRSESTRGEVRNVSASRSTEHVFVHELEGRHVSCKRNGRSLDGEVAAASSRGVRFTVEWFDGSQSKHSKRELHTMLCAGPRVEDLSYLRSSKRATTHPYHAARVGPDYQAALPLCQGSSQRLFELPCARPEHRSTVSVPCQAATRESREATCDQRVVGVAHFLQASSSPAAGTSMIQQPECSLVYGGDVNY